ncbi:A/G-specific adenine glycosylase [Paenibacillus sp. sptzw28]|uniref:A/G-specific adenine glycosylase n=1 Tax=Paenibacillus sp. sptzw28 TaxID=715179 RepID=UPI001C6E2B7D|nr:A/G-specific adenine glycosylase [Paenibacillus sp. sptzw28]QYR22708.1 A/G-specific adenine glycosylase [Paenibacillus sp. sptzw28]
MTTEAAGYFSRELLSWYLENKRTLPWRMNRDPYRIWVSEVMLQQTRVDTVIPYYERFMEKFPTAAALAEAPEAEVLKCWEGLGYYSRARNLQAGAGEVVSRHGGTVPDDKEAVSALRGIGPYTAGAIMSIAFNRPEPAVDGNVMRVLSRYFCLEDDIAKPSTRVKIEKLAASLIPEGSAGDFNQGLMELGALVCTPKSPGCLTCPVMAHCEGRMAGKEHTLPVKTKAKPPRPETRLAALVVGTGEHAGKVLVRQRQESGLLARMWELPHVEGPLPGGGTAVKPRRRGRGAAPGPFLSVGESLPAPRGGIPLRSPDSAATAEGDGTLLPVQIGGGDVPLQAAAGHPLHHGSQQHIGGPPLPLHAVQSDMLCRGLYEQDGLLVRPAGWWGEAEHVFSHIVWNVQVYRAEFGFWLADAAALEEQELAASPGASLTYGNLMAAEERSLYSITGEANRRDGLGGLPPNYRWIGPEQMRELAFPNVFLRLLRDYWDSVTFGLGDE